MRTLCADYLAAVCVVLQWFTDHPQYISNPFYLGGDSYAGKVIPLIAQDISEGSFLFAALDTVSVQNTTTTLITVQIIMLKFQFICTAYFIIYDKINYSSDTSNFLLKFQTL